MKLSDFFKYSSVVCYYKLFDYIYNTNLNDFTSQIISINVST